MGVQKEKKWVIAGFVVLAGSIITIFGLNMYRESQKFAAGGGAGGPSAGEVASLKELAAAIKNPETREQAIKNLSAQQGDLAIELLAALAHKNKDPEVRAAALTALGDIGSESTLQVMTIGARDQDVGVRLAAVEALSKMTNDAAYTVIGETVANDVDVSVRKRAAEMLGGDWGSAETIDHLRKRLTTEDNTEVRALVAMAMKNLKEAEARNALISVFRAEKEAAVRLSALKALDAIDDNARVKGVACAIGDADEAVRAEAKRIFGELGTEALPAMAEALKSGELQGVIRGNAGVHADILQVVAAMESPDAAEPLAHLLDQAIGARGSDGDREKIRDDAIKALSQLGEPAIAPLKAKAFASTARWGIKQAAAKVFGAVGKAAIAPISEYATARIALPSSQEAKLWIDTLDAIGGPEVEKVKEAVKSRDPAVVFDKIAEKAKTDEMTRPPAPQVAEYRLIMYKAFYGGNPPSAYTKRKNNLPFAARKGPKQKTIRAFKPGEHSRRNVDMNLTQTENGWERVLVHHLNYNNGVGFAQITRANVTDEKMEFGLRLAVGRDPYLVGGYGEYSLVLEKVGPGEYGEGEYRGKYKGKYHDIDIEGDAICVKAPKRRPLRPGWTPVQPNEHPRMLFRKCDLPKLRAKLNTPLGKAAFRRMLACGYSPDGGGGQLTYRHVALGLLYRLTGDERYAQEAIEHTKHQMKQKGFGFMSLGQVWGPRFSNIAHAYDLCYDAWPVGFRSEVESYMYGSSYTTATKMQSLSVCANDHPCSNYHSPICGGGAALGLAYYGIPGPAPTPPGGTKLLVPAKFEGKPGKGVPVLQLVPNQSPRTWLWSGPILNGAMTKEMIDSLGDTQESPIVEGRTFKYNNDEFTFKPIERKYMQGGMVYPWNVLAAENPDCGSAGMLLHVVLENHRPGFYRVMLPAQGDSLLMIGGVAVPNRAFIEFKEGFYSMTLSYVGQKDMVAGIGVGFKLMTSDREEIAILLKDNLQKSKRDQVFYDLALEDHKKTGMDGNKINTFYMTVTKMVRSHRLLMGDGGFQSEGEVYTHTAITPLRYAAAYYNVFGQTATPYPDVTHFPTRYIATSALHPGGTYKGRVRRPTLQSDGYFGGGGNTHGVHWICTAFRILPEKHKPAALWVWNKLTGVEEGKPETLANLVEGVSILDVINTFVNYPMDMKPVHPRERITKNWVAKTKGVYVFRNAWEGKDDIIFMAAPYELKTHGNSGPDVAGLRLRGFGHAWTGRGGGKKSGAWLNNIPIMLEEGSMISGSGPARVLAYGNDGNGSGYLTIDMDNVYSPRKGWEHDRGGVWPLELPEVEREVTGVRAVAADYTGKCGAPGMIVIVDKIVGGPKRHWVWHPAGGRGETTTAKGNTFTMLKDDGVSVHGTFVPVPDLKVEAPGHIGILPTKIKSEKDRLKAKRLHREWKGPEAEQVPFGLMATAPEGQSFFLVMTMQKGPPPEVKIKGEGLKATVCIGKRQIRFDGEKVVIEDV